MIKKPVAPKPRSNDMPFVNPSPLSSSFPSLRPGGVATYDKDWAYALAVIAGWTYANQEMLADVLPSCRFADATVTEITVENDSIFVVAAADFVQVAGNKIGVLSFRGTEPASLINWLTDADTAKYNFAVTGRSGRGAVHSGFFANVQALWSDIVETIDAAIEAGMQDLYITGHSLGGAMAVLAAARIFDPDVQARMAEWKERVRGVYTFGQPMVGDGDFRRAFEPLFGSMLYRHIYDDDVVPCLPPTSVDIDFVHFGSRRIAPTRDASWSGPQPSQQPERRATMLDLLQIAESFVTRRIDVLHGVKVSFSLDDHSPRGYIDVSRNSIGSTRVVPTRPDRGGTLLERALWKALQFPRWPDRRTLD